ncbi:beta-1,3-galactosyltransferase 5-like [Mytilus californianus]|uniref:beta-1,3-galactosyltransferase 5-like n=1 Tax=Mytilus californianus TaxID=6549 RepID=UPI0022481FE0|nr:beta-1,3-galactosyltransferase 5-like [Mytilus californianus]
MNDNDAGAYSENLSGDGHLGLQNEKMKVLNKRNLNVHGLSNRTGRSFLTQVSEFEPLIEPDICKQHDKILLAILIFSNPSNIERRQVIRETWLSDIKSSIRYVFVVARNTNSDHKKELQEEIDEHKDIVQFDFIDSYKNLTFKTVSSFKWIIAVCPRASYVLKIDDDMWLNKKALTSVLEHGAVKGSIGGNCHRGEPPIRDPGNKYYIPWSSYPYGIYPPFCSGTAYVVDFQVMKGIVNVSKDVPYFPLEDIYVALCMTKLKAKVINLYGFNSVRVRANPCWLKSDWLVTTHEFLPFELRRIWNTQCYGLNQVRQVKGQFDPQIRGSLHLKRQQLNRLNMEQMFRQNAKMNLRSGGRRFVKSPRLIFN